MKVHMMILLTMKIYLQISYKNFTE